MASQYDNDDDDYEDSEQQEQRSNSEWAALRQEKKARRQAEEQAQKAQRELAFVKAGINPDDPRMSYFVKGYDGDISPDAIKQAAVTAGFMQAPDAPDPQVQQAVQSQQRIAMAASAGVPDQTSVSAAEARLVEAYEQGGPQAMLAALIAEGGQVQAER